MKLHSIPPANRSTGSLARLSSLRAAMHVGLTMVGSGRCANGAVSESDFKPRVIAPNRDREAMRMAIVQALSERREFWQEELVAWAEEFGEAAVRQIKELI